MIGLLFPHAGLNSSFGVKKCIFSTFSYPLLLEELSKDLDLKEVEKLDCIQDLDLGIVYRIALLARRDAELDFRTHQVYLSAH